MLLTSVCSFLSVDPKPLMGGLNKWLVLTSDIWVEVTCIPLGQRCVKTSVWFSIFLAVDAGGTSPSSPLLTGTFASSCCESWSSYSSQLPLLSRASSTKSEGRPPGSSLTLPWMAVWPWVSYFTSLSLSFFIFKRENPYLIVLIY